MAHGTFWHVFEASWGAARQPVTPGNVRLCFTTSLTSLIQWHVSFADQLVLVAIGMGAQPF